MIFHSFTLSDVEDPEIYAAGPLYDWQQTEKGKWVMAHCTTPAYKIMMDQNNWGYRVVIYGELSDEDTTYYTLKYE